MHFFFLSFVRERALIIRVDPASVAAEDVRLLLQ